MTHFAGSTVLMADGSKKPVENLSYGDMVKDILGNNSMVDGVRAINFSLQNQTWLINNSFMVPNDTIVVSAEGKYLQIGKTALKQNSHVMDTIRRHYPYIVENNKILSKWSWADCDDLFEDLQIGSVLIKENNTTETVTSIEKIENLNLLEYDTIYGHSVSNAGIYWVDGYACTARMNEKWDYRNMVPIVGDVSITHDYVNDIYAREINVDFATNTKSVWDAAHGKWLNYWMLQ